VGGAPRRHADFREAFDNLLKAPLRRLRSMRIEPTSEEETFWAIRNLDFEVAPGEVLGIIGRNGAGKSTLLKILSRITAPTEGRIELRGRLASLLEVGTGFHPDLTGRDNIYMNGTFLGMRKKEIDRKFDEILAFAEVERFIDTPVKRYSSGMYVRLAFAVAAHLEPEILLVDEVLAVGDANFQRKCLGKLDDMAQHGRTVVFVSHNLAAVQRLCRKAMLLQKGRLVDYGPVGNVVKEYLRASADDASVARFRPDARRGLGWARIVDTKLVDDEDRAIGSRACDQDLRLIVDIETTDAAGDHTLRGLVLELMFVTDEGHPVTSVMNVDDGAAELPSTNRCRVRVRIPSPTFMPGRYRLGLFLGIPFVQHVDDIDNALSFEILPPEMPWRPYELHPSRGVVCIRADWKCESAPYSI
jgi:lipopolysaccharide transport system ATP-binding protein